MEETSLSAKDSLFSVPSMLRKLQTLGFCSGLDGPDGGSDKDPEPLFNRVLVCFLKETSRDQEIRPVPALLGNGRIVDLFKLYREVHENGGWESVTKSSSWMSVSESIGCDRSTGSALKLVYYKYFDELDRRLGNVLCGNGARGSVADVSGCRRERTVSNHVGNGNGDDVVMLDSVAVGSRFSLLKRKRDPSAEMLSWLLSVAKGPCDPSVGKLTLDGEEDKKLVGVVFSQVLMVRKAMFLKKIPRKDDSSPLLEGRKRLHPLLHEDSDGLGKTILRCSPRLSSLGEHFRAGSSPETTNICQDRQDQNSEYEGEDAKHDKKRPRNSSPAQLVLTGLPSRAKRVHVGQSYQAMLPIWNPAASASSTESDDSKWLGTRIWPPEKKENRYLIERVPVGRGRQTECGCECPGSVQCVRFHVGEKRQRLKHELGSAFSSWRFDSMGEEVALSWTDEEERKFKALVRLNPPSLGKNYWDQLYLTFPYMGRKSIVSYYFNVFLLRCRSCQNRMAAGDIDSDDEEKELSFSSNGFGSDDALKVRERKGLHSSPNVPFVDLDDFTGTS
ncbi:AT-rich interactive domain-containing protein 2 [Iris pallida]|uniref:AT-rich interactive domain-containing protein 2 n=1 Tax=Iris pallida TaxID=29817 RepID=A0AAX6HQR1_IRIPA|nr:AT-rich interactive domain-containing protein 2 [Iris pallida]